MSTTHLAATSTASGARSAAVALTGLTAALLLVGCPGPTESGAEPLTPGADAGSGPADAGPPPTLASSLQSLGLAYDKDSKKWTLLAEYTEGASTLRLEANGALDASGEATLAFDEAPLAADHTATLACPDAECGTGTLRLERKTGRLAGVVTASVRRVTTKSIGALVNGFSWTDTAVTVQVGMAFRSSDPREGKVSLFTVDGGRSFMDATVRFASVAPRGATDHFDRRTVTLRGPLGAATRLDLSIATTVGAATQSGTEKGLAAVANLSEESLDGPLVVDFQRIARTETDREGAISSLAFIWSHRVPGIGVGQ